MTKFKKEDLSGVPCDTLSKNKKGNHVIRKSFFYRTSSADEIAKKLKEKFPNVNIVNTGDKFTAFRGGDTVAQGSHYWVEFNFNNLEL